MTDCILWSGWTDEKGYGRSRLNGKTCGAHRAAYCLSRGIDLNSIKGMAVMHICDTPACVNPEHLKLGTLADNNRDKAEKQRGVPGFCRKLTQEQAEIIRSQYIKGSRSVGMNALARQYGMAPRSMWLLLNGVTYRYDTKPSKQPKPAP